jgi:ABC-type multidrug transport system fused ATPase/permease subunit
MLSHIKGTLTKVSSICREPYTRLTTMIPILSKWTTSWKKFSFITSFILILSLLIKVSGLSFKSFAEQFVPRSAEDDEANAQLSTVDFNETYMKVLKLTSPEVPYIAGALLTAMVTSVCDLFQPILIGRALDAAASTSSRLSHLFVDMAILQVLRSLAEYGRERLNNNIGDFVRQRAQEQYVRNVLRSEVGFFDATHTSELNKLYHNLYHLHFMAGHQIPSIIRSLMLVVATATYMMYVNPFVGGIVISVIIAQGLVEKWVQKRVTESWYQLEKVEKKADRVREEGFTNIRTVKHFSCEDKQENIFLSHLAVDRELRKAMVHIWGIQCGMGELLLGSIILVTWYLGLNGVQRGVGTVGEVSSFVLLVQRLRESVLSIIDTYSETVEKIPPLYRTFKYMDRTSLVTTDQGHRLPKDSFRGEVELSHVHFKYPTRPDSKVLDDLSLKLAPGTCTALCGTSGGGKSSIASLILRDYDTDEGSVRIDGWDIRDLNLKSLHKQMAVVSQEPILFSCSIADNIKFGVEHEVTPEEVIAAAKLANAHEFIMGFDNGYEENVGEKGARLSGGQKQRIAIARAILMDPRVLILDEATSALDADNESLVQAALDRVMVGRTTLIIAHRLSTIRGADNIIVIDKGRVAEQGNHNELVMRHNGVYASLVEKQLKSTSFVL